jgi:hypothetical protein
MDSGRSQLTAFRAMRFDLLLNVVHHRYSSDQDDGGDDLVRMKVGVEEAPGDADRGQGLHHFKVADAFRRCCVATNRQFFIWE